MKNTLTLIKAYIASIKGVRMAQVEYITEVKTAAVHKGTKILKQVSANIQLFGTVKDHQSYVRSVIRGASRITENNPDKVASFEVSASWHRHSDLNKYSIVVNPKSGREYLYCIYNSVRSVDFTIDGKPATKEEVADYLTPSAKKELYADKTIVYNKTNDVLHTTICRTIALDNIISIK